MKKSEIGVRTLDIQSGLYKYQDALIDLKLRKTILIGKAASLASHLRGVQVIENFEGLITLASKLGISAIELEKVLEILDDIRYINIIGSKDQPDRIEVLLSKFQTTYERLGEKWETHKPAEFEQKMVQMINELSKGVKLINSLTDQYDLSEQEFDALMDIGSQGGLINTFEGTRSGEKVLYSPIYMEENPEQVINLISKYSEAEVSQTLNLLTAMPGYPVFKLNNINNMLLLELMNSNIYQTPAITASGGTVNFLFSPFTEAQERQMLKHARFVVAAVRYGERFSRYSNLHSPLKFINSLLDRGYIGQTPHTDIEAQYGVLRDCGLGRIEEVFQGRFRFFLADTDYAKDVVRLAKKILFTQTDFDPEMSRGIVNEAWDLRKNLSTYQFNDYIPNLRNIKNINKTLEEKKELRKSSRSQKVINSVLNLLFTEGEPNVF
ncbi:hypothetical protein [Fictibacillus gelatini]|uniref:hypothetical protein n=1 Tax=Fictibacillus gelatini TaxID=225985 RepID=UPI00040079C9|nr:hypothetical protein [Fictibacillus gelatini]